MQYKITIIINGKTTITRSPKLAYKLYDEAMNKKWTVEQFTDTRGHNLRDRQD